MKHWQFRGAHLALQTLMNIYLTQQVSINLFFFFVVWSALEFGLHSIPKVGARARSLQGNPLTKLYFCVLPQNHPSKRHWNIIQLFNISVKRPSQAWVMCYHGFHLVPACRMVNRQAGHFLRRRWRVSVIQLYIHFGIDSGFLILLTSAYTLSSLLLFFSLSDLQQSFPPVY